MLLNQAHRLQGHNLKSLVKLLKFKSPVYQLGLLQKPGLDNLLHRLSPVVACRRHSVTFQPQHGQCHLNMLNLHPGWSVSQVHPSAASTSIVPHYPPSSASIRWYSQSDKTPAPQSGSKDTEAQVSQDQPSDTSVPQKDNQEKSTGLLKRFHDAYKEYGKALIGVHLVTSAVWFGSFFYAAYCGLDIVPFLQKLGVSETVLKPLQMPGVGNAAVAYLLYKLATPARYTVTIVGTQLTVKYLRHLGYMESVPKEDSIRQLVKEGTEIYKDKYDELKDDVKDKYGELKDDVKDKYDEYRDKFKSKDGH